MFCDIIIVERKRKGLEAMKNTDANNRKYTVKEVGTDEAGRKYTDVHTEEYGTQRQYCTSKDYESAMFDLLRWRRSFIIKRTTKQKERKQKEHNNKTKEK